VNAPISGEGFSDFVKELRTAGFSADINQITAAYQLLLLVASGDWPDGKERLTHLLAPMFARTPAQQADFHNRFAKLPNRLIVPGPKIVGGSRSERAKTVREPDFDNVSDDDSGALRKLDVKERRLFAGHIIAALALVALCSLTAVYFWPEPTSSSASQESVVRRVQDQAGQFVGTARGPSSYSLPVAIPFALLLLPPCVGLAIWLASLRRRSLWSEMATEAPRDLSAIRIVASDAPVFEGAQMDLAARDLSRHRRLRLDEPDIARSIEETVRRCGLATLVMVERSVTPQYVFLIEETSAHDHIARLGDLIVDRLSKAGVLSTRYYISSPNLVRNVSGDYPSLNDLPILHGGHRLLVIGPGEATVDYSSGELCSALVHEDWADRAYLVVDAIDRSTARRLLRAGYALVPATIEGIRIAAQYLASASRGGGLLSQVRGFAPDPP
jgi:hypothetical protein